MQNQEKQLPRHKKSTATSTATASTMTIAGIFAIIVSLSILFQIGVTTPAHALSHYFNCIIRTANKSGDLTLTDVETCYDKVFTAAANKQPSDNNNNNNLR